MAKTFPDKAEFLNDLNDRMVDLEDVFKTDYVDARFDGSTSIKKVLPVVCPDLDYSDLDVQDGSSAMEAWERMLNAEPQQAERITQSLLSYCERDTFAMVEIHRFLSDCDGQDVCCDLILHREQHLEVRMAAARGPLGASASQPCSAVLCSSLSYPDVALEKQRPTRTVHDRC